ncbi:MAG TPA: LysM peptidoglycan-binding domain-containing protein [Tepidisphaeraceae bacterium]
MGFAVGGVLLAVLVVVVLVFHRNKNANKAVSLDTDPGKNSGQVIDTATPDPAAKAADAPAAAAAPTPINPQPLTPAHADSQGTPAPKPAAAVDPADKGDKWDALFNSTAEDPIKAQLTTSGKSKAKNNSKKRHKADAAPAADAPAAAPVHETPAAENAAANIPLEATTAAPAEAPRHAPVVIANSESPRPARESGRTHTIAAGETFVSIARAVYGDGRYFKAIEDANPNVDPGRLKPGMTIQLPPASQVKESRKSSKTSAAGSSSSASPLSADRKTYTVQKNDSLYRIAKKVYGDGEKHEAIYAANKQVIGPDSTRLQIGMVLTLPEPPTVR